MMWCDPPPHKTNHHITPATDVIDHVNVLGDRLVEAPIRRRLEAVRNETSRQDLVQNMMAFKQECAIDVGGPNIDFHWGTFVVQNTTCPFLILSALLKMTLSCASNKNLAQCCSLMIPPPKHSASSV
jgi:hypothetical protein